MSRGILISIAARIKALFSEHWRGRPGEAVRDALHNLSDAADTGLRDAPEQIRRSIDGALTEKHAKAVLDYSKREESRIEIEIKRRTIEEKVRQECAKTRTDEASAGLAEIHLLDATLDFYQKVEKMGLIAKFGDDGRLHLRNSSLTENDSIAQLIATKRQTLEKPLRSETIGPFHAGDPRLPSGIRAGDSVFFEVKDSSHVAPSTVMIMTSVLPSGILGIAYGQAMEATGGIPPYVWGFAGSLPPGLSLSSTGVLSGTPTTAGAWQFELRISDQRHTVHRDLSIAISPVAM